MTRVLLVDDDFDSLGSISRFLRLANYDVTLAEHAEAARARLSDQAFDLVITDLKMPGDSGLDLCRDIRRAQPKLPVILISGMAKTSDVVAAMRDGALTVLEKPLDPESLIDFIEGQATQDEAPKPLLGPQVAGLTPALGDRVKAFEAYVIEDALKQSGGKVKGAMEILGLNRRTLNDKMNRLGIDRSVLKGD